MIRFVATGFRATFSAVGHLPGTGIVVATVLIVGLAIAVRQRRQSGQLRRLAAPLALLAGSVVLLAVTASGRLRVGKRVRTSAALRLSGGRNDPARSRGRGRHVREVVAAVVRGHGRAVPRRHPWQRPHARHRRTQRDAVREPAARDHACAPPRSLRPAGPPVAPAGRALHRGVTIGWLLDGVAQHRIPAPPHTSPALLASNRFRLSFDQEPTTSPAAPCRTLTGPLLITLRKGDVIGLYDRSLVITPANGLRVVGPPLAFAPDDGSSITVLRDVGRVRLTPGNTVFFPPRLCEPRVAAPSS